MANPAPTINQINAFNATQGTTIDFNIIGGTELVRSNRIYIYDLSDNSLICTHLYVSTESIHELPANTDSSIVYESGKSSADFVNGAQYYAQIQTYTDTAGTEGGSGLSVAKMFWCLVDPTLTITTIPSTISTTSYNVLATYNANASVVSNIIQQYQFNLYSATGSLLQSSGVVVGSGTQQGTSDVYDISYNFTGLNVGSSYYVTVEVTTTQGMSVSAQSNTFTVSIDTPTLGEATVVNNACDGYISVTSNLSGEYGGSASGEIASFVTSSINDVSSLKVNLEPIQDLHGYDSPWVGGAGKNKLEPIDAQNAIKYNGSVVAENLPNGVAITGTAGNSHSCGFIVLSAEKFAGKTLTYSAKIQSNGSHPLTQILVCNSDFTGRTTLGGINSTGSKTVTVPNDVQGKYIGLTFFSSSSEDSTTTVSQYTELQIEEGSTATSWTPWENICPIYGHDSVGATRAGKNLLSGLRVGYYNSSTGAFVSNNNYSATNKIQCIPSTPYVFSLNGVTHSVYIYEWDKFDNYIGRRAIAKESMPLTTSANAYTFAFASQTINKITEADKPQIELGTTATDYEPYEGDTYTANLPQTVYGGWVDLVTGEGEIDRAMVTLDGSAGSLSFSEVTQQTTADGIEYVAFINAYNVAEGNAKAMSSQYEWIDKPLNYLHVGEFNTRGNYIRFVIHDQTIDTLAKWNNYLASNPMQLVYKLATPIPFNIDPQVITTLYGRNNVWSEQGDVEITYNIPITNLLVKRQDVADVSGDWLTLYSQPITQPSDMDFTFIDFTNQYGKTYKYALVPLLTQTQSGVEVEVEGGYTVSDEVQSIFDGVFIADSTGSQKCKANVGYGNVDMNQVVGSITPIGAKYPVVITNSQNQYHNGSISGTIVPDDYYFNGNLSRIDMVNKRNELEQFLTNKRAKIIKDWNSNIWLVMITDNISCSFNNNYGMGMVNFSANWVEVGDPTNQQDLQATGLINVGGV